MVTFFYRFLVLLFFIPLAVPIVKIGSKPVDLVLTDFYLCLAIPFFFAVCMCRGKILVSRSLSSFFFLVVVFFISGISLALVTSAKLSNLLPVISAIRFYKPLLFFGVGYYLARKKIFLSSLDENIYFATSFVVISLVLSTIFDPRFPSLLWGGSFVGAEVYGFPNSSMTFCSVISLYFLSCYFHSKNKLSLLLYFLTSLTVVLSLSRSSVIVLIIGSIVVALFYRKKLKLLLFTSFFAVLLAVLLLSLKDHPKVSPVLYLVNDRIQRTLGNTENDASSGRLEIWNDAIQIILERPLLGYGFESFSNYSEEYDTPHQQYLEVLYKTGIFGFLLYSLIILYMFCFAFKAYLASFPNGRYLKIIVVFLSALVALSFGNLTQPNFSYPLTANLIFFLFGVILVAHEHNFQITKKDSFCETTATRP